MNLKDLSIVNFCEELASKNPTPGGGSAAAAAGSIGLSLVLMTGNYAEDQEKLIPILEGLNKEKRTLLQLIDDDASSFTSFMEAMKLPKNTKEEKIFRRAQMQDSLKHAADIPFETLKSCSIGIKYMQMIQSDVKSSMLSDLGAAAVTLSAAIQSAYLNVVINANSIKDKVFTENLLSESNELKNNSLEVLNSVFESVQKELETNA
ncbi:MAG: cyclodeaminase/cyclohydrolase family protein [Caldisericia bacterium]|nr:cyclodeaminase/cyclohydrolase family protein [Caldisericia bacterium]